MRTGSWEDHDARLLEENMRIALGHDEALPPAFVYPWLHNWAAKATLQEHRLAPDDRAMRRGVEG